VVFLAWSDHARDVGVIVNGFDLGDLSRKLRISHGLRFERRRQQNYSDQVRRRDDKKLFHVRTQ
jgi:hypothetical protein